MISSSGTAIYKTVSIPAQLQNDDFRFIRIKKGWKEPIDKAWQTDNNFAHDSDVIKRHIESGGNYGIICHTGNACILDADEYKRLDELDALSCFSDTFTVRTGNDEGERYHYFFKCQGLGDKKIPFYDLRGDGSTHLGELYPSGSRAYCVGPNCVHPSGNRYTIVNDSEIKEIRTEDIDKTFFAKIRSSRAIARDESEQFIKKMPVSFVRNHRKSSLVDTIGLKIQDIAMPDGVVKRYGDDIQGTHPKHGSTTGHNFSVNQTTGLWYCYRCKTGGDALHLLAVMEGMIHCDQVSNHTFSHDEMLKLEEVLSDKYGYGDAIKNKEIARKNGIHDSGLIVNDEEFKRLVNENHGYIFQPNLDESHFLTRYADTICELTDSYRDYQYICALSLVSICIQRRMEMRLSFGRVFPNVWGILLGASSFSKKSTALSFARNIISDIAPYQCIAEDITPERYAQDVQEYKNVWQYVDEVSQLLKAMKSRAYMATMREFLCSMYDNSPYKVSRVKNRKKKDEDTDSIIKDGYVSLLYATTPENFFDAADIADMSSGYFYRFLFCFPRYPKDYNPTTEETDGQRAGLDELARYAKTLYDFFGSRGTDGDGMIRCRFGEDGLKYYQDWEKRLTTEFLEKNDKVGGDSFNRARVFVLKLMMLIEVGSHDFYRYIQKNAGIMPVQDDWISKTETVIESCRLVETYFIPIFRVISDRIRNTTEKTVQDRILSVIDDFGGNVSLRDLRMRVRTNRRTEFSDAMDTLTLHTEEGGTGEIRVYTRKEPSGRLVKYVGRASKQIEGDYQDYQL